MKYTLLMLIGVLLFRIVCHAKKSQRKNNTTCPDFSGFGFCRHTDKHKKIKKPIPYFNREAIF